MELFMMFGALLSLLVWAGLLCMVAGLSRSKNAVSAMLRGVAGLCAAVLAFYVVGNPLAMQSSNSVIGFNVQALQRGLDIAGLLYFASMLPATVLLVGTLHERSRFAVIPILGAALCGLVLPLTMHWMWRGWLLHLRCIDVAGAAAIWLPAAVFALAGAIMVGPRSGKYNQDGSANGIVGHSVPLAFAGVAVLLMGWLSNAWSHNWLAPSSIAGPLLAGSAGGLAAMIYAHRKYGKVEAFFTLLGLLSGLVSVSAVPADALPPWGAIVAGAATAWLAMWASIRLDVSLRVDDPISSVATFGVSGMVAMLVPSLVVQGGALAMLRQLGVQLLAVVVVAVLAAAVSLPLLLLLKKAGLLRSSEADEYDGLDLAEHDVNAYADFQQTMIKSYHLREA